MNKVNIHLYQSPFIHETRILRITKSLSRVGVFGRIIVIASLRESGTKEHEILDEIREVWRVPSKIKRRGLISKVFLTLQWSIRSFYFAKQKNIVCVNPHSLSVLPLAVLIKFWKGCKLVYDAHEIETGTTEVKGIRKIFSEFVEKVLIRYIDALSLTSEGHAVWYKKKYNLSNVWVIRNCPNAKKSAANSINIFRKKFKIPKEDLLFLYQGAIAKQRGTDLLMRVFSKLTHNKHIVFLGFGSNLEQLLEYEKNFPNIHYHQAVSPDELHIFTACADVGIHMMDDSCVNHLYALPNKPMEYMNAGIPAIVSDLPEMGRLIRDSGAGWVVPVNDELALEQLINSLSRTEIIEKGEKAKKWASANTWEKEENKLFAMYKNLGLTP